MNGGGGNPGSEPGSGLAMKGVEVAGGVPVRGLLLAEGENGEMVMEDRKDTSSTQVPAGVATGL